MTTPKTATEFNRSTAWWQIEAPEHSHTNRRTYPLEKSRPIRTMKSKESPLPPQRIPKTFDLSKLSPELKTTAQFFFKIAGRVWTTTVTDIELKQMYRGIAKKYHPDANLNNVNHKHTELFRAAKNAYQTLIKALK